MLVWVRKKVIRAHKIARKLEGFGDTYTLSKLSLLERTTGIPYKPVFTMLTYLSLKMTLSEMHE